MNIEKVNLNTKLLDYFGVHDDHNESIKYDKKHDENMRNEMTLSLLFNVDPFTTCNFLLFILCILLTIREMKHH
jgi:hypothetical protein